MLTEDEKTIIIQVLQEISVPVKDASKILEIIRKLSLPLEAAIDTLAPVTV